MPQQKCLAVFVLSYSGEWVGPDGQDNPSVDIYRYLSKVAARVLQWAKAHPESEVFVVCNGGIGIAGRPEAEVLSKFFWSEPGMTDRVYLVKQLCSWTTPSDLEIGDRALAYWCARQNRPMPLLEDPSQWDVIVTCASAYAFKTRVIASYMLAGRKLEMVHYPVGGNGWKLRLKQLVSYAQEVLAFATTWSTKAKHRKRLKQIENTPGLSAPEVLKHLV